MEKVCERCGIEKPISAFRAYAPREDGLRLCCPTCKACEEKRVARKRELKAKNREQKHLRTKIKVMEAKRLDDYRMYSKGTISRLKASAAKRGLECDLTEESLKKWWLRQLNCCAYCGSSPAQYVELRDYIIAYTGDNYRINRFKRFFSNKSLASIHRMTFDRRDNSKGYTLDNIVKACWICNSIKGGFFMDDEAYWIGTNVIELLRDDIIKERIRSGEKGVLEKVLFESAPGPTY